jgi:hypothetical protein
MFFLENVPLFALHKSMISLTAAVRLGDGTGGLLGGEEGDPLGGEGGPEGTATGVGEAPMAGVGRVDCFFLAMGSQFTPTLWW